MVRTAPNTQGSGPSAGSCIARCVNTIEGERKLIVGAAVERTAGLVFPCAAPLLEEEWHPLCAALTTDLDHPFSKHRSRVRTALTPDDDPIDSVQVERTKISQERLDGQEADSGGRVLKRPYARETVPTILDADAEGNGSQVGHPSQFTAQQLPEPIVPFGEDLEHMPVGPLHDVANARDVVDRNVFVKEVAHRVDENLSRAAPVQWLIELFRNESEIETLLERVSWHSAESFCEQLRIAELAARTHLRAAPDRIPRCVRPLDGRAIAHGRLVYARFMTGQVTRL
jgi:hypothetical protein